MCAGRSQAEIARARGTSPRTIANQMASVYRKLGIGSRLELHVLMAHRAPAAVTAGEPTSRARRPAAR